MPTIAETFSVCLPLPKAAALTPFSTMIGNRYFFLVHLRAKGLYPFRRNQLTVEGNNREVFATPKPVHLDKVVKIVSHIYKDILRCHTLSLSRKVSAVSSNEMALARLIHCNLHITISYLMKFEKGISYIS
ncbi:MAG: hypothetical protein ACE3L7_22960 [Candidatus Pristimantibacillus sp.]